MSDIHALLRDWNSGDLWALGLCCFLGVSLLTWAVTEVWERRKPALPPRPVERPLTNRELCALLNCEPLRSPQPDAQRGSIRDFKKMHTR